MTLPTFQKCDKKYDWAAYIRIGLYYVNKMGQRVNFCDVHMSGMAGTEDLLSKGVYSGPKDSSNDIRRLERSKEAKQRYFLEGKVHSDLDLSAGGWARFIFNQKQKQLEVWLLGPLLFEGTAYGSLVARLQGFEAPTVKSYHRRIPQDKCDPTPYGDDPPGSKHETGCTFEEEEKALKKRWDQNSDPNNQRFKLSLPKNYRFNYLPCTLLGSDYSEGTRPRSADRAIKTAPSVETALTDARSRVNTKVAVLPKTVIKAVWKIEDHADELTACDVYARKG